MAGRIGHSPPMLEAKRVGGDRLFDYKHGMGCCPREAAQARYAALRSVTRIHAGAPGVEIAFAPIGATGGNGVPGLSAPNPKLGASIDGAAAGAPQQMALPKGSGSAQACKLQWSKRNGLPAPVSVPEAAFAAVSAAISFAGLATLMFEFACATQAGTVATVLCLFDQVLCRRNVTNARCWRCPGSRDKKTEARCCSGSDY